MDFVAPTDGPYIFYQGKKWLDFSSCDFLGLAQHPEVKKAAIKYTLKYGVGIPVSPLRSFPQQQLEAKLAQFVGTETALLFPSYEEALAILKQNKKSDVCDDTFFIGIAGEHGFGLGAHQSDLIVGSLAYGLGCSGAYIAGPKKLLQSWTPSQPLCFPALGALDCALNLVSEMVDERKVLEKNYRWLQNQFQEFPVKFLKSPRAILEFKSEKEAGTALQLFAEAQIFVAPPQEKRLTLAMTALHTPDDLDQLATVLKKFSTTDWALTMQSLTPTP